MNINVNMQLSHMLADSICQSGEESAIIDSIHSASRVITRDTIQAAIQNAFHVEFSADRLNMMLRRMLNGGSITEIQGALALSPSTLESLNHSIIENESLELDAFNQWAKDFATSLNVEISMQDDIQFRDILKRFFAKFFLAHGAECYDFINGKKQNDLVKLDEVSTEVVASWNMPQNCVFNKQQLSDFLSSVFSENTSPKQEAYLLMYLRKAVHYLSMVVDKTTLDALIGSMRDIVIYLDTSIIYRLLNLQGKHRYESITSLLSSCKNAGMTFKVFQCTVDELKRRIQFDSRVIAENPVPVSFAAIGYRCRTDENYISTYWKERAETGISANDFNFRYTDILAHLDVHNIEIDEHSFISEDGSDIYSTLSTKVRQFGTFSEKEAKSPSAVYHDAECLTNILFLQRKNASSVLEARTFFLSTDWSLIRLQRHDHDFESKTDMVVLPSQLMQVFCLSTPNDDYFEAFLGLFASSHIGFGTNKLNNEQVQQIMGRVASYNEHPDFAERVLCNQLIQQRFSEQETEDERATVVDEAIREEITKLETEIEKKTTALQQSHDEYDTAQLTISRMQAVSIQHDQQMSTLSTEHTEAHRRLMEIEGENDKLRKFRDDILRKDVIKQKRIAIIEFVICCLVCFAFCAIFLISVGIFIPLVAAISRSLYVIAIAACNLQEESLLTVAGVVLTIDVVLLTLLLKLARRLWVKIKA